QLDFQKIKSPGNFHEDSSVVFLDLPGLTVQPSTRTGRRWTSHFYLLFVKEYCTFTFATCGFKTSVPFTVCLSREVQEFIIFTQQLRTYHNLAY
ncbi:unnamed protein product, partial [Allacma fusca]